MDSVSNGGFEQFQVNLFLDRTWTEFRQKTFPIDSLKILWRSFESPEELMDLYFNATGQSHLLEEGAELTPQDRELIKETDWYAKQVYEYREWARNAGGDPLFREELVRYCSAFENALKRVALVFRVLKEYEPSPLLYIEAIKMKEFRVATLKAWSDSKYPTAENFCIENIVRCNPNGDRWDWQLPQDWADGDIYSSREAWDCVKNAFTLRNKIIHEDGFLSQDIDFVDLRLAKNQDVDVDMKLVRKIQSCVTNLMWPLEFEYGERHS